MSFWIVKFAGHFINKRKDDCMNKKKIIILSAIILAVIILSITFIIPFSKDVANVPVSKKSEEVLVVIDNNTSTFKIGTILEKNGLIRNRFSFFFKAKTTDRKPLNSGTYTFNKNMSIKEIIAKLSEPQVVLKTVMITFPEGYTAEQMGELLEEKHLVTAEEFMKALEDEYDFEFIKKIPEGEYNHALQGFLFPNTYEFYENSTAHDIIHKMLSQFEVEYMAISADYENVFEIVTKASMIEKEAKLESERPKIAGVIENRIKESMPLQVDATVLYASTNGLFNESDGSYIANQIATFDSPYNTYKYPGLPAGPICNPGLTSLKAALSPEEHNYLYYHTDNEKDDGSHIFTETYSEHLITMN